MSADLTPTVSNHSSRASTWYKETAVDAVSQLGSGFLKTRFSNAWASKRSDKSDDESTRGPIGLRVLHSSPEPLVDLIFVHGLRGGSIKTWRKGADPRLFWPKLWLPLEPGLQNANIHSFGYDSDWASTKSSILNIHDFGRSLLEEMRNSPHLRDSGNGPIILLGHSMGGLVIKKAYILARDVPDIYERIRCIFFLATPHKGSDYAATLNNVLTMSGVLSSRDYINDLITGSTSTELINDDFGRLASDLFIFSFYETLRMNVGLSSNMIVDKSSAVLGPGFRNERAQYLNANHRDICKFENPDDPNYITLKNAITSATQDLLHDVSRIKADDVKTQLKTLKTYLGISDLPDEQYTRIEGSCQWLDGREDFQDWRDSADTFFSGKTGTSVMHQDLSIFWVSANPGTGKTFLAAHVVDQLHQFQLQCAYHFFHIGHKATRSLSHFLRSIAYQMAMSNAAIREMLVELFHEGSAFDIDDARSIWNKIYKNGILQVKTHIPQYWVVDAIDECTKFQELFTLIKGISLKFPLRLFITSRKMADTENLCRPLKPSISFTSIEIPAKAIIGDIESYIQVRVENLPLDRKADRQDLANRILSKSNACFLWVRLVLDELQSVYSHESILEILQNIPEGMVPYYERTISSMAEKREKHIAKAVLIWVWASTRTLNILELSEALKLDIDTVLPSTKSAVEGLCGQLVSIEDTSDLVDLIHPTAREFLVTDAAGEFSISRSGAHERLALACLKLLCGKEMKPPRNRRLLTQAAQKVEATSSLLEYALTQYSEHIYMASAETDKVLIMLDRFLRTHALSWIERIAQTGNLHYLIRASKNFKGYLNRRAKYTSPLSAQVQNINNWSIDLSRLVAKFGAALLHSPTSIYFLIPPLCPSGSAIYQQFGKRPDGLAIVGFNGSAWDDCIASIDFGEDSIPAAVSCGENSIAVGMESGDISLYNPRSCHKEGVIQQKYPIDQVHFTNKAIVACTTRFIMLMDQEGTIMWRSRLRFRCIHLTSSENSIIAVSQHGHVLRWDITSGALLEDQYFPYRDHEDESEDELPLVKAPIIASTSTDAELLALGYTWGTVCVWDISSGELLGWARDDDNRQASVLLFNPNPDIGLLLAIYNDHEMSLFDAWSPSLVQRQRPTNCGGILSASCSPDGRTLATADKLGNMHIWDFESLDLLYHVLSPAKSFKILAFTSDGSSVVEAMDSGMRIWSPATLVRKNIEEDQSTSDAVQLPAIEGQYDSFRTSRITAMCAHPSTSIIFIGKHNGQILSVSAKTGREITTLYSHSHASFITQLAISTANQIASCDSNGNILVWDLGSSPMKVQQPLGNDSLRWHVRLGAHITQICFSKEGDYLLVSTTSFDQVYATNGGSLIGTLAFEHQDRGAWRWVSVPSDTDGSHFALVHDYSLIKFSTKSFPEKVECADIHLEYDNIAGDSAVKLTSAAMLYSTKSLVLEVQCTSGFVPTSSMFIFNLAEIGPNSSATTLVPLANSLTQISRQFIGLSEKSKTCVFLDSNSWLDSVYLPGHVFSQFSHHAFVPGDYMSSAQFVPPILAADDSIVFCMHGDVVIMRNGLGFIETKAFT